MIYIFYKMLMFKMLNINECIFGVCVCVCAGEYSIQYVSAVVNWQCVKM